MLRLTGMKLNICTRKTNVMKNNCFTVTYTTVYASNKDISIKKTVNKTFM